MRGNPSAASPPVSSCFSAAVVLLRISEFDRLTSVLSCLTSHPHIVSRSENTVGLGGQHLSIAFLVLSRLFGRELSNRKLLLLELKKLIFFTSMSGFLKFVETQKKKKRKQKCCKSFAKSNNFRGKLF